ncbi:phosphate acyltransferase PlsX [bacterium]|nr:phosphate acyltransferase PlsX [Akkermansiaceae bacterium]MDB4544100.1 phosphate acyltransferase PlsX [bacterium]MDB4356743.1 phosphate acyltransferase PlsX [Akkermansiaceae bacterium]MDB4374123.1 phosphate acyltransferase PlsX [Akkermansiaceae bacterium]MDB4585548.1 phosphate acyltransferase PlsX [Akkermansiaceae bacterium]
MKIALDAMGGDHAPGVNLIGARDLLRENKEIQEIILTGPEDLLRKEAAACGLIDQRIRFVDAQEVVGMDESGAKALRRKKNSSIAVAADLVKRGEAGAMVSAGNTGAAVAAATVKLRLLKGVARAGIASPMPNEHGICNLLDSGANPEAKPAHLLTYAIMGSVYAREVLKVADPHVGIMSNGEEDEKGTTFTKETMVLLKHLVDRGKAPFTFRGNVEGHDLFQTKLDVCLCDGFTGNIVLKSCEATAKAMSKWMKAEFKKNPLRIAGALMGKGAFQAVKDRTNYESYGGSPLLGVNGVVIIAHGGSSALAIKNALRMASEALKHEINPKIEEMLNEVTLPMTQANPEAE